MEGDEREVRDWSDGRGYGGEGHERRVVEEYVTVSGDRGR
jgi:hypothetical protein